MVILEFFVNATDAACFDFRWALVCRNQLKNSGKRESSFFDRQGYLESFYHRQSLVMGGGGKGRGRPLHDLMRQQRMDCDEVL